MPERMRDASWKDPLFDNGKPKFSEQGKSMTEQNDAPWGEGKQQHEKIDGYRQLSDREIADMNRIKALGVEIGKLMEDLSTNKDYTARWLAIGETHLQQGLMAATRAVARPTTY